jgi:hypothetical protein
VQNREDVAVLPSRSCPFAGAAGGGEGNREEYRGARSGPPGQPCTALAPWASGGKADQWQWESAEKGREVAIQHDRSHVGLRGQSLHSFRGQGTRPPGGPGRTGEDRDLSRGRTQRGPLAQLVRAHG